MTGYFLSSRVTGFTTISNIYDDIVYIYFLDESCWTYEDCMRGGKICDGLTDYKCICKNGKCKISCMKPLL